MDLTFGEIMQAAARDDPRALENSTLWTCDDLLPRVRCPSGIDIASVILVLVREAELRGIRTPDDGRWTADGGRETEDRA